MFVQKKTSVQTQRGEGGVKAEFGPSPNSRFFKFLNTFLMLHSKKFTMTLFLQIATEGLRLTISPGVSAHMAKLIKICMNEDPGKRPTFDMIIPILEKMKK